MSTELGVLEGRIGHAFSNRELLERALTHKSHVYEKPVSFALTSDNEQLEFLGDAILGFIVSDYLVRRHREFPEGRLSKLKAHLVSATRLHEVAQALELGQFLFLGRGEEMSGGRAKKALLADAVEAVIAAVYLDGGIAPVQAFIECWVIGTAVAEEQDLESVVTDYKSALQEMAQSLKLPTPRYVVLNESGPEHAKTFLVEVRLGKEYASQAKGQSKKSAGQIAAQQVLQRLAELDQ